MTVDRTDPYAVLGLTPNATQGQIRHAYRTLVRQHHPDTRPSTDPDHDRDHNPDRDPERDAAQDATLRRVVAAYAVLRERRRRADDDQQPGPAPTAPIPVRRVTFARRSAPEPPPVQVGPVRWHGLRR